MTRTLEVQMQVRLPWQTKGRMALAKGLVRAGLIRLALLVVRRLRWQYRIGAGDWRLGGVVEAHQDEEMT